MQLITTTIIAITMALTIAGEPAAVITKCASPGLFALTFDDGPSKNIPSLLAKLGELKVPATFFVNAKNYADFTDANSDDAQLLKAIYSAGHQIASHTYDHADLSTLSVDGIVDEMQKNDDAIKRVIGSSPLYMRPPYLGVNDQVLSVLGTLGYKVISTNLDTKDYEHSGQPNEVELNHQAVDGLISQSDPSTDSFISLDHDHTSAIVGWIGEYVPQVQAKGYKLVTVAECLGDSNLYR